MGGSSRDFDVVIVGARCAGSPLAAMLARRGLRVCAMDRSRFPSEALSTHVIQPCGVRVLESLGLLEEIERAGAMPLSAFTLVDEEIRIDAETDVEAFGAPCLCLRRVVLDELLVRAAEAAGAEVRTETAVRDLVWEGERVAGVRTEGGEIRAPLVIGADGRASTVAGLLGAREYHRRPPGRLFAWGYFEGVADMEGRLRLGRLGDLAFLACPTDSGLYMAGACPPIGTRDKFLAAREDNFAAGLATWPELADLLEGARRVGPVRVMAEWHGYFRKAAGPGWALVGDAGHFKDPTPAQGISDALRHSVRLADAVEAGLGGGTGGLDAELEGWWRWRDEDVYEMHRFAADIGDGTSPLLSRQLLGALAEEEAGEGLLHVLNHDISPAELFTARRVARAVARAAPRAPGAVARELANEARNELRHWRGRPRPATQPPFRTRLTG